MSEVYRFETRDENGSEEGSRRDCDVGIDTDHFVWEDVLEEIGRFENFDIAMKFTGEEWYSFSKPLRDYILAKRLLYKIPIETNPESKVPDLDPDAKRSSDVNVTVRSRSSNRVEQETVESGNEEIGSSMQRIVSSLLQQGIGRLSNK